MREDTVAGVSIVAFSCCTFDYVVEGQSSLIFLCTNLSSASVLPAACTSKPSARGEQCCGENLRSTFCDATRDTLVLLFVYLAILQQNQATLVVNNYHYQTSFLGIQPFTLGSALLGCAG